MIEQAIVFMVAVSLPLMLVVEQITCWRSGLREKRRTTRPRRSRHGTQLATSQPRGKQERGAPVSGGC